jgi:hypothetical protein
MAKKFRELALALFLSTWALVGCGKVQEVKNVEVPRLDVTCADPAARRQLVQGATFRDLALSRAEAIAGWKECHSALSISNYQ